MQAGEPTDADKATARSLMVEGYDALMSLDSYTKSYSLDANTWYHNADPDALCFSG